MTVVAAAAVSVPLLVAGTVCLIAYADGSPVPARALVRLLLATVAALVAVGLVPAPGLAIAVAAALFVLFVTPVTRALELSCGAEKRTSVRTADLVPRTVHMYLPHVLRGILVIATLCLLIWVGIRGVVYGIPLMTAGFTFAALAFLGLYEAWIRQEVFAVRASDAAERRRRVRAIFAAQFILTTSFLILAALAAGPWPGVVPLGVVAAAIGSVGCGLALSTGVQRRFLEIPRSDDGVA